MTVMGAVVPFSSLKMPSSPLNDKLGGMLELRVTPFNLFEHIYFRIVGAGKLC